MPAPIPLPLRRVIVRRAAQGQTPAAIAVALKLSLRTVRHLLQRFESQEDLRPSYCPGPGRPANLQHFCELALTERQKHPTWGAGYIRVRLCHAHPGQSIPSERALQRYFRQHRQSPAPPGRPSANSPPRADRPHQRWQMDAAEQFRLKGGQGVSWLRLVDECSGAFLSTKVFPPLLLGERPRRRGPRAPA